MKDVEKLRHIETVDEQDNPLKLYLKPMDYEVSKMCDIEFRKAWTFCLSEGVKTHAKLRDMFNDAGIWTAENERELNSLNIQIATLSIILEKHKQTKNFEKAKEAAFQIMEKRNRAMVLAEIKNEAYQYSCEGVASEVRLESYIAYATVYEDDYSKKFFKNYEDFKDRRTEKASIDVYAAYLQIVIDENQNHIREYPENKFLIESNIVDENLKTKKKRINQSNNNDVKEKITKKKASNKKKNIKKK